MKASRELLDARLRCLLARQRLKVLVELGLVEALALAESRRTDASPAGLDSKQIQDQIAVEHLLFDKRPDSLAEVKGLANVGIVGVRVLRVEALGVDLANCVINPSAIPTVGAGR